MSLLDKASLIVTPNAYKESKLYSVVPNTTLGDMDFVRATTATRVNSAGLIEVVPRNLYQYSNDFTNANWSKVNSTVTANQVGYDGTNNASLLIENSITNVHRIQQTPSLSGQTTISVYAKANTRNWLYIRGVQSGASVVGWFNLTNGTLGTIQTNGTGSITSIGNGWYRCSLTIADFQSGFETYIGLSNANSVENYLGNGSSIYIQNTQVEFSSTATEYFPTTTRLNMPRIDYTNGSCPSLLVEPQRTNSIQYSNAISAYFFSGVGVINAVTSPQGINNAFSFDVTNGTMGGLSPVTITTSAQSYTFSVYLKGSVNGQKVRLFGDLNGAIQDFTLTTEWARYTKTFTGVAGAQSIYLLNGSYFSPAQNDLYYGYGMQIEVGAYATSLIPTTGSALTRNADVISKTGISSLIGQTEGTLFCDVNLNTRTSYTYLALSTDLTNASNYLGIGFINNAIAFESVVGAALQASISYSNSSTGRFKIAAGYKANDFVLYINGTQIGVDTSGTVPACSQLGLTAFSQSAPLNYNSVQVYKTKLSNTELAQLTTL